MSNEGPGPGQLDMWGDSPENHNSPQAERFAEAERQQALVHLADSLTFHTAHPEKKREEMPLLDFYDYTFTESRKNPGTFYQPYQDLISERLKQTFTSPEDLQSLIKGYQAEISLKKRRESILEDEKVKTEQADDPYRRHLSEIMEDIEGMKRSILILEDLIAIIESISSD